MIPTTEELVKGVTDVPSLPAVFMRVNEAVNNPRSSITDIGTIIGEDTGLTARLLRIVNSAFYGFPSQIETISRAVTIVGTQQLRDLALATSVLKLFKGISHELIDMESFWKHSVCCGVAARLLATYRRESNVERFFAAGILHDIGRLLICMKEGDLAREIFLKGRREERPLYEIEAEILGYDHTDVGRALIQEWKLPASLEEVVSFHHHPARASRYPVEAAMIHVADIVSHAMQVGSSGETMAPVLQPGAWERLGLPISVLSPTMEQVDRQYHDAAQMILSESHHV